jgi:membrane protein implicated in regulation of membrane protease activity
VLQAAAFTGLTALIAFILWKPLKKWRTSPSTADSFSNMVGDMATVGKGGLKKGVRGQASWSGTTMTAMIAEDAQVDSLDEGAMVIIQAVHGTMLLVAPKA